MQCLIKEKLELYDRPMAIRLLQQSTDAAHLMKLLEYKSAFDSEGYPRWAYINNKIDLLFEGKSYNEAKIFFRTHYLGI